MRDFNIDTLLGTSIFIYIPMDPITLSDDEQGVYNHLLRKVFRFHYHSQKVIGSLGIPSVYIYIHISHTQQQHDPTFYTPTRGCFSTAGTQPWKSIVAGRRWDRENLARRRSCQGIVLGPFKKAPKGDESTVVYEEEVGTSKKWWWLLLSLLLLLLLLLLVVVVVVVVVLWWWWWWRKGDLGAHYNAW